MILLAAFVVALSSQDQDRAELTKGVTTLNVPGALPGRMVCDGPDDFVVLTGKTDGNLAPLAVAGRIGSGRALAIGHGAFYVGTSLTDPSGRHFVENSLSWLAGKPLAGIRVGVMGALPGWSAFAAQDGFTAVTLGTSDIPSKLNGIDVLFLNQDQLEGNVPLQKSVIDFVKAGHGLIETGPAWGWQQLNPKKSLKTEHAGNVLLMPYGIGFSGDTLDGPYTPNGAEDPLLTSGGAMAALSSQTLSDAQSGEATAAIESALSIETSQSGDLLAQIKSKAALEGTVGGPTHDKPFNAKTPFSRLQARVDYERSLTLKPEDVKVNPASAVFPGAVPADAKRISRVLDIDCSVPDWHSTGLYAAPGEVISIQVKDDAYRANLSVRIGSHTDELWGLSSWTRFPAISRSWPLSAPSTNVASSFGGLIYVEVPEKLRAMHLSVKVSNAVMAPLYIAGKTSLDEWKKMVTTSASPWAEFQGKLVTLIVPRHSAALAPDPKPLMEYWDEVMTNIYAFYAAPRRPRQERYCTDEQISAGYMHSGYPIMTWLDVADNFCSVDKLRKQGKPAVTWGFYHEMGHNFQQPDWTFDGTGEVTNNLFSLYGTEKFNGLKSDINPMTPEDRRKKMVAYFGGGSKFEKWQEDPFLALIMYAQLKESFGWQPFTEIFADYEKLTDGEHPKTEMDKHDQWMVRFSKKVGKNLGPFFVKWGVPTSGAARDSISKLGAWMPPDLP